MHVHGLDTQRMTNHLLSSCPFNAAVTTLTITAKIGGPLHRLDSDLLLLDVFTDTFRTGSVAFRNSRVVRMQLRSTRGLRWISTKQNQFISPYHKKWALYCRRITSSLLMAVSRSNIGTSRANLCSICEFSFTVKPSPDLNNMALS